MSGHEDLMLWKKLSHSDIKNSHEIYIRRKDEHKMPEADLLFFDETIEYKGRRSLLMITRYKKEI